MNKGYKRLNQILAGIIFICSFLVYFDTMAPTVSYWDCGEFIAVSYRLAVPHPPGSPLYLLLGRIISMIPFSSDIAFRVNILSPLSSALAVMFLYLSIVIIVTNWRGKIANKNGALISFGGAAVGALTFAFTDSHWFNAVEAEVYSMSTFFTAIVVWLILHWNNRASEHGHERYILIISYMIGLATGLHLLNLLTLPFIALVIYFRKYKFNIKSFGIMVAFTGLIFFIIHNGIIKGLPKIASLFGIGFVFLLIVALFGGMVWSVVIKKKLMSVALTSMILVLIGYSSYALIFIRSNQNPGIDENDPETIEAFISYLEREQYGDVGIFPRRYRGIPPIHEVVGRPAGANSDYSSQQKKKYRNYEIGKQWDFFWNYQIRKMYNRYFLWQFAGRGSSKNPSVTSMGANSREDGIDWTQFGLPLALILGLLGMIYHGQRDQRMAFSVMTLFIMTGYAIILYLNQDNPQPRERDYSYVGSFFAFSIWIGVGAGAINEKITKWIQEKQLANRIITILIILQLIFVPGVMLSRNYHSHDRSGNYVAWDYSYNLLQSCGPNGVIFTNGDNDTFPLWYLQEVEGLRTDVAVVNLSLLNTPWYIKQMRDLRPKKTRFINLTDTQIDRLTSSLTRWETQKVKVPVYGDPKNKDGFIEWTLKPTFAGQALRVQDMMIMRIISDADWRVPIYFAVTVSQQNRIGLDPFLDMQGLTFHLKSHKTTPVDADKMYENLMTTVGAKSWSSQFDRSNFYNPKDLDYLNWSREYQPGYMFRNLGNKEVYYNNQIIRLLQNYRSAYMQLAVTYYLDFQRENRNKEKDEKILSDLKEKTLQVLDKMSQNIPETTIPITTEELHYQVARMYGDLGRKEKMREIMDVLTEPKIKNPANRVEYANIYFKELFDTTKALLLLESMHAEFLQLEKIVSLKGFGLKSVTQNNWRQWQQAYPDIVSSLIFIYRNSNKILDAELILNDWVQRNPNDKNALKLLQEISKEG
ncbi:MAG: hypothetical protein CMG74_00925 [Candidatus Marinimicrobia bacterium]|nr:hypothetical protein [Candidatus Neomarinimicrobiota bacterium]